MPSTINVIPDIAKGQLRKNGGTADANLTLQTNSINAVVIDNTQNANFVSTGAITLPRGTTAQRPSPAVNGMWRYNTSYAYVEVYVNNGWSNLTPILTPISNTSPVVGGSTIVGGVATVTNGTWNNSPTSYTYQWFANSTVISANGAANTFTVTATQLGANLSCQVTAYNSFGASASPANSNSVGPVTATFNLQYVVVAGGGAGGGHDSGDGGGGGAGGLLTGTISGISAGITYTATVGAGAAGGNYGDPGAVNGSNSTLSGSGLSTVTCYGGGAGGNGRGGSSYNGASGGSGGGSAGDNNHNTTGGSGTSGQGNAGGSTGVGYGGSGGGGAGGAGAYSSGQGGVGLANPISGSTAGQLSGGVYYLAGGGGGGQNVANNGGLGGGGAGATTSTYGNGNSGTGNTGGGGGGSGGVGGQQPTISGGSGVIVLSVPTGSFSNTYTGTATITTSGANTIITFTGSGTYTS